MVALGGTMGFNTEQDSYAALRSIVAEGTRSLLAFVGSGASVGVGLPTWASLRVVLVEGLRNKSQTLDADDGRKLMALAARAETEVDPWVAFEILAEHLGRATFRDLIRQRFGDALHVELPKVYENLWSLRIKGMLTLNLDRLAVRSLGRAHPNMVHIEHSGANVHRLMAHLTGPRPFVGNLHGVFEDTDTWVFTRAQLAVLKANAAYQSFVEACMTQFAIVFVGISVDDVAVGGHLERLARRKIDLPTHYWISDRSGIEIDRWAERAGIRMIRYRSNGEDHSELDELFADLHSYVPSDPTDEPPVHDHMGARPLPRSESGPLPPERAMLTWPAERIRQILNAHAERILNPETPESYAAYDEFSRTYDEAIYQAWYTTEQPPKNELLGYELKRRVARGAFGQVYRAHTCDGRAVAVKVLLDEVRQDPESLRTFRRGVRSMRILQERDVEGMGAYIDASEIPAFVVMDWIEGPNLAEAKEAKVIDDWYVVLGIVGRLTTIIRSAHSLPERVLHRDIRPANIMLRGFWEDRATLDVVVLDFDLSWHKGASEKSVLHTSAVGYLAPEQLRQIKGASTRSAFVDSFGIGMTLLYLCNGVEPSPEQHRHQSWETDVREACAVLPSPAWVSLPSRVARLILAATRENQTARWDLAEIERELALLQAALTAPGDVSAPELLTEEIAARSQVLEHYRWSEDRVEAVRDLGTGLRLVLRADLTREELEVQVTYASTGVEERGRLSRYIRGNGRTLGEQFRAAGWRVVRDDLGQGSVDICVRIDTTAVRGRLKETARTLDRTLGRLGFERT